LLGNTRNLDRHKEREREVDTVTNTELIEALTAAVLGKGQTVDVSDVDLVQPVARHQVRLTEEGERIANQIASLYPEPVLILGPAGTGKSLLIRHIAKLVGVDFVAVNAHQGMDISQLVGLWRPVQTEDGIVIEWQDGSLTRSIKTGGLFLFEEITRARLELLSRLFGLLDTDGRYWPLPEAGIDGVEVHQDFWFVATGNPPGAGYHTASLDTALQDRFQAIYTIDKPLAPEREVLASICGEIVAGGMDRFASDARRNKDTYVSTRNLVQAARLVQRGIGPVESVSLAISPKFKGHEGGLNEIARLHLDNLVPAPDPEPVNVQPRSSLLERDGHPCPACGGWTNNHNPHCPTLVGIPQPPRGKKRRSKADLERAGLCNCTTGPGGGCVGQRGWQVDTITGLRDERKSRQGGRR
jgi:MoxR-like ATPase